MIFFGHQVKANKNLSVDSKAQIRKYGFSIFNTLPITAHNSKITYKKLNEKSQQVQQMMTMNTWELQILGWLDVNWI